MAGVWTIYYDVLVKGKAINRHMQADGANKAEANDCRASSINAVIIQDYVKQQDTVLGRCANDKKCLHMYAGKFIGGSKEQADTQNECYELSIKDLMVEEAVSPWIGAKKHDKNSFYITLTPSLDVLHISYQTGRREGLNEERRDETLADL